MPNQSDFSTSTLLDRNAANSPRQTSRGNFRTSMLQAYFVDTVAGQAPATGTGVTVHGFQNTQDVGAQITPNVECMFFLNAMPGFGRGWSQYPATPDVLIGDVFQVSSDDGATSIGVAPGGIFDEGGLDGNAGLLFEWYTPDATWLTLDADSAAVLAAGASNYGAMASGTTATNSLNVRGYLGRFNPYVRPLYASVGPAVLPTYALGVDIFSNHQIAFGEPFARSSADGVVVTNSWTPVVIQEADYTAAIQDNDNIFTGVTAGGEAQTFYVVGLFSEIVPVP